MSQPLFLAVVTLAAYRVTRLLVRDQFPPIETQRARIAARWGDASWQAYLAQCPWCAGVYVSGIAVVLADWYTSVPAPAAVWGAVAAGVGLLAAFDAWLDAGQDGE